ncbi:MAG TPA: sn-glycerol-3-phosphate ABC transporter ATP-binding protein UgpC [Casimicrobiaceae bacterium]
MAAVQIRNVAKRFDGVVVMQDIDLDVADGEFIVLVGASGCGKSTLLRMIAGLEPITAGDIAIGGRRVNELEPRDRDVAMVFQSYALYPHLDVRENMSFSLRLRKRPADEIAQKVDGTAHTLALEALLDRRPRALSGGQRQRVAMGRAIVRHPQLFLFDEPLSNLDAKLRVAMRTEIRALHQRLHATSIYVTHDQVEAMTMADRMVVMNAGRIEQIGRPLDVYDHPETLYVAQFIGSPAINVWRGSVERGMLRTGSGVSLALPGGAPEGEAVAAAFRPEHVEIGAEGPVEARVDVVETLGPETYVYMDVSGLPVCARVDRAQRMAPGDRVRLRVAPHAVHVFDAAGRRLAT